MSPPELAHLRADLAALGATDHASLAALTDDAIAQAVVNGGYGQQRIASQIIVAPPHTGTLPLAATFLLMGQRYVVDSHVLSNVVYDRVNVPGAPMRMMPNPLDVGFAALGNDQAGALLAPELERYQYAPDLEKMRILVEAHGADFWSANLYNRWLGALRALSPSAADLADRAAAGLPSVASTEAWGRRLLSAQLASWAELRHDTILYVKQSYTFGTTCEYPDAYVEPNPAFFARIAELATAGSALAPTIDPAGTGLGMTVGSYFTHLADVAAILQRMAEHQRTGLPHDAADIAFINGAVTLHERLRRAGLRAGVVPAAHLRGGQAGRHLRPDHRRRAHPAHRRGGQPGRPRPPRRHRPPPPDGRHRRHLRRPPRLRRPRLLLLRDHHPELRPPRRHPLVHRP